MQQVQQPAMAEIDGRDSPRAADATSAAGRERENQASPQAGPHARRLRPSWRARAASLEHDSGLTHGWREPFAKLLCGAPPGDYDAGYWERTLAGASIFAEQWAVHALHLGWSAEEVFGLDDIAPAARHDRKGLAWFLADGR